MNSIYIYTHTHISTQHTHTWTFVKDIAAIPLQSTGFIFITMCVPASSGIWYPGNGFCC